MTFHHEGTKSTKVTQATALALSHEIIGAAIEVHRVIGPGLLESIYEFALCRELWLKGVEVERQVSVPVSYTPSCPSSLRGNVRTQASVHPRLWR